MNFSSFFSHILPTKKSENSVKEIGESEGGGRGLESGYTVTEDMQVSEPFGELSYSELREVYLKSSSVRPCVDSISRYISSLPWIVRPKIGGDSFHVKEVKDFLLDPNSNKESLRTILAKLMVDLLVVDAGVIEKVRSRSGKLLEIYARDGATFTPIYDKHGSLLEYEQNVSGEDSVPFESDEVIYSQLYPRTWNFYGTPIIETITDEVATLMFSISNISETFQKDEIPAGILSLDKVGEIAYKRLKEDLTSEKGSVKKNLKILRNVVAKWIEFKRPFREMQLVELNQQIENIVHKNFGIKENMEPSSKMILALTQTINYFFNREIISEFYDDVYFKLIPLITDEREAKAMEARSRAVKNLVLIDILEKEEARKLITNEFLLPEESLE